MDNYDILYKILDCNDIAEYYIYHEDTGIRNGLRYTKSEAYDYLLENKLKIVDVSVYENDFLLRVSEE